MWLRLKPSMVQNRLPQEALHLTITGRSMGYIHCCGALHKTRTFMLVPQEGYLTCELDVLVKCPICGSRIVQLTRIENEDKLSVIRKTNAKAKKFFENLKSNILYEVKNYDYSKIVQGSKFFLNYNEFGVKKRCYSNLSGMKLGKFDFSTP